MPFTSSRITSREMLGQALLLGLLLIAVFPGTFFRAEMIAPGDLLFQAPPWKYYAPADYVRPQNRLMSDVLCAFFPYYAATERCLQAGEWPLWNDLEFGGMPLLANCQSAVLYPPRLLHAFFGIFWGTTLYVLMKLWLCGMTAYWCGRGIGLKPFAARFISVGWMLSSYNLIWCNWSLPDVSAWLPVLVLGVERIFDGCYRKGFLTLSLGGTLILLAGHPETAFGMSFALGIYFLLRLLWERRRGPALWGPITVAAGAWVLAILVTAAQLIPFCEYLLNSSTFFDRPQEEKGYPLPAGVLIAFWIPRFFGASADNNYWMNLNSNLYSMVYPGMAVWALVPLLFTRGTRVRATRPRQACLAITVLIGVLMSFGSPPFDLMHRLPVFSSMLQAYHIGFPLFALLILAGTGLEHWLSRIRTIRECLWSTPIIIAGVPLVAVWLWFYWSVIHIKGIESYTWLQVGLAAGFALLSIATICAVTKSPSPRFLAFVLTAVLACDLLVANRRLNPTIARERLYPETRLTRYLQSFPEPCRIGVAEAGVATGIMAVYGVEEWLGYDGLYPARMTRLRAALRTDFWKALEPACAIRYYLNDPRFEPGYPLEQEGRFEYLTTLDGIEVYRNRRVYPRAFLVGNTEVPENFEQMVEIMRQPTFNPKRVALLEDRSAAPILNSSTEDVGAAEIRSYTPLCVTIETNAKADAVLVLADAYFPGWQVIVDGNPAEIFPVDYIFKGVTISPGTHRVEFVYHPWSFRIGLAISCATCIILSASGLATWRRRGRP